MASHRGTRVDTPPEDSVSDGSAALEPNLMSCLHLVGLVGMSMASVWIAN